MSKVKNALLAPSTVVGRYTIEKKLANGGFGVVYMATRSDGEKVALKEFLPSIFQCRIQGKYIHIENENEKTRFKQGLNSFFREADTLAKVHSSRIVPIWDVFKENGTAYFAMPIERGGTLQTLSRLKKGGLSEWELRHIFVEACKGVEELHSQGLLHLDIKPSNLWLRPDMSVVVLDLGASRWEDEEMKHVHLARTPGFAAPEQHITVKNRAQSPKAYADITVKADIYGMTASLLSCLRGKPPMSSPERRPFHPPIAWGQMGQASQDLIDIINQGMSMSPALRQSSMKELRHQLENLPRLSKSHQKDGLSRVWSFTPPASSDNASSSQSSYTLWYEKTSENGSHFVSE